MWILKTDSLTLSSHVLFELAEVHDIRQLYAIGVLSNIMSKKITVNTWLHDYTIRNRDHTYQTPTCMKTIGGQYYNYLEP